MRELLFSTPLLTFRASMLYGSKDQSRHLCSHHTLWTICSNTKYCLLETRRLNALGTCYSSHAYSGVQLRLLRIPPTTPTNHHKDGPTYLLRVFYFTFLANWTFNARSWPLSKMFKALILNTWKIVPRCWMKLAVNSSALQLKPTCQARKLQRGILPHTRAVKCIATHPTACSMWRASFFDLVITNKMIPK